MKVSCVKIWFSNNPDVFLPEKNQQRLRKLRESHPEHPIIFVVACKLLSENANQELIQFCEELKLNLVDLETLKCTNVTKMQHKVQNNFIQIAEKELNSWIQKKGGNPGTASDFVRWLPDLMDGHHYYADFDVPLQNETKLIHLLNSDHVPPFAFNVEFRKKSAGFFPNKTLEFHCNNDVIFISPAALELRNKAITFMIHQVNSKAPVAKLLNCEKFPSIEAKWQESQTLPTEIRPQNNRYAAIEYFSKSISPISLIDSEAYTANLLGLLNLTVNYVGPIVITHLVNYLHQQYGTDYVRKNSSPYLIGKLAKNDLSWSFLGNFHKKYRKINALDAGKTDIVIKQTNDFYFDVKNTYLTRNSKRAGSISPKIMFNFLGSMTEALTSYLFNTTEQNHLNFINLLLDTTDVNEQKTYRELFANITLTRENKSINLLEDILQRAQTASLSHVLTLHSGNDTDEEDFDDMKRLNHQDILSDDELSDDVDTSDDDGFSDRISSPFVL